MNAELYNQKREELVALLAKSITEVGEIIDAYTDLDLQDLHKLRDELIKAHKHAYDNIFKILLVAKFQGGKSTSFNAMSDGLCYSPMGNGAIKCSASAMTIMNVDDEKNLGATIRMRTLKELSALLMDVGIECDLEKESVEDARAAWKVRYEEWQNNKRLWTDDNRDLLFVTGLIVTHLTSPSIQQLLKKGVFDVGVGEIPRFSKFPDGYRTRYSKFGPSGFSPAEVLFPFVSIIEVRAHASSLRKIGAIIEDCPGLFASSYDTMTTKREMSEASAVWYLFDARMPGHEELEAIRESLSVVQKGRIFFSANVKGNLIPMPTFCKQVLPQISEALIDNGIEDVTIRPYHALGALTAILCEYYLENRRLPSEASKDYLLSYSKEQGLNSQNMTDILSGMADHCMRLMYPMSRPQDWDDLPEKLSVQGVAILKRESNLDGVVEEIKSFVVTTKAKSVLISDTSEKALKLVKQLMELLRKREMEAGEAFDAIKRKYDAAENKLNKFVQFAKERVDDVLNGVAGNGIDKSISTDFRKAVFADSIDEIADIASSPIRDVSGTFRVLGETLSKWTINSFKWVKSKLTGEEYSPNESAFVLESRKILRDTIAKVCGANAYFWAKKLQDGENEVFNQAVVNPASLVLEVIRREWDSTCKNEKLLGSLDPTNEPLDSDFARSHHIDRIDFSGILGKNALTEFTKDLVACALNVLLFGFFGFDPITIIIAALIAIIRAVVTDEESLREKIRAAVFDGLLNGFSSRDFDEFMEVKITPRVAQLRQHVVDAIMTPITTAKAKFIRERDIALATALKEKEVRDRIATECREIRERIADGDDCLGKMLENYIRNTEPLCLRAC